jgi:DNA-binding MarR family transcriptional regulator
MTAPRRTERVAPRPPRRGELANVSANPSDRNDDDDAFLAESGHSGLLTRLNRISLLLNDFQHRCFDEFGLRFIDYSVLRVLQKSGPPYQVSPTKLSEVVVRSTGGMTQILDRLEFEGLVERSADPSDRRKVIVSLTKKGLALTKRANRVYVERKSDLLAVLSDDEFDRVDDAVRTLLAILSDDHRLAATS